MKKTLLKDIGLMLLFFLLFKYVLLFGIIPSASMEPTLLSNSFAIINGTKYWRSSPERGDIIVFYSEELEETLIKRVIGLPGEEVSFEDGLVHINGSILSEPYLSSEECTLAFQSFKVPEQEYFLLGDNRMNSYDSRFWEEPYIHLDEIKGELLFSFALR